MMTTARFEGIFNSLTAQYLDIFTADEVEAIEAIDNTHPYGTLVGVIHEADEDGMERELTFVCHGEGPLYLFPPSWTRGWDDMTPSEQVENLRFREGQTYEVDPDYWTGCPYKFEYPINA